MRELEDGLPLWSIVGVVNKADNFPELQASEDYTCASEILRLGNWRAGEIETEISDHVSYGIWCSVIRRGTFAIVPMILNMIELRFIVINSALSFCMTLFKLVANVSKPVTTALPLNLSPIVNYLPSPTADLS